MRNLLTRRASGYAQAEVDAWFADALATGRGHYADPAARQAAATEQQLQNIAAEGFQALAVRSAPAEVSRSLRPRHAGGQSPLRSRAEVSRSSSP
ncbi:hypothetical protein ACWDFR_44470 [Streptomyces sp. 900105755]